jgi:predicted permease
MIAVAGTLAVNRTVLSRPLPYEHPSDLLVPWEESTMADPTLRNPMRVVSAAEALRWRSAPSIQDLALFETWDISAAAQFDLVTTEMTERLRGVYATNGTFELLGTHAFLGRLFSVHESAQDVAVISYGLWQRRFGSDSQVIGRSIRLITGGIDRSSRRFQVIGVLPPDVQLTYPKGTEVWLPRSWDKLTQSKAQEAMRYRAVLRIRPGNTPQAVQSDLERLSREATNSLPPEDFRRRMVTRVTSLEDVSFGDARPTIELLSGITAILAIFATVAVSTLFLAQIAGRRLQFAVLSAIGATPRRMFRQVVAEGVIVTLAGAALAVLVLSFILKWLSLNLPASWPRATDLSLDRWVLSYLLLSAISMGIAVGLVPAWIASRSGAAQEQGALRGARHTSRLWESGLTALQVAVLVLMATTAGLLLRTLWSMNHVDLGFVPANVVGAEVVLTNPRYRQPSALEQFRQELVQRVGALPIVSSVSIASSLPFHSIERPVAVAAVGDSSPGPKALAVLRHVDVGFFRVLGIPLLAGREFTDRDRTGAENVTIISQSLARSLVGDGDPIGRFLDRSRPLKIVGIVGDVRYSRVGEGPQPAYYVPIQQGPTPRMSLVVRTSDPEQLESLLPGVVHAIEPEQPVQTIAPVSRNLEDFLQERRFYTLSTTLFSILGLLVTAAGVYGATARAVAQRTKEAGIRLALGGTGASIVRAFFAAGMVPIIAGLGTGTVLSVAAAGLLRAYLVGVGAQDLAAHIGAAGTVLAICAAVVFSGARRVLRTDIATALRID